MNLITAFPVLALAVLGLPAAGPGPGRAVLAADVQTAVPANMSTDVWAGYAAAGAAGTFTSVSASWTQPAVYCGSTSADQDSAFWVGLDGYLTPTDERTGTEASCTQGVARYHGWYELFPKGRDAFAASVQPGDVMSASVSYAGNGSFTLTLSDSTEGWTQTVTRAEPDAQLGSAEVIVEAPNSAVLPLANFVGIGFTGATVTADDNDVPIGNLPNLTGFTLMSTYGTVLAAPSAVTGDDSFSVTYAQDPAAAAVTVLREAASPVSAAPLAQSLAPATSGSGAPATSGSGQPFINPGLIRSP